MATTTTRYTAADRMVEMDPVTDRRSIRASRERSRSGAGQPTRNSKDNKEPVSPANPARISGDRLEGPICQLTVFPGTCAISWCLFSHWSITGLGTF